MSKSKSLLFWILSLVLMTILVIYQRATGPTYPVKGEVQINNQEIDYRLLRSFGGEGDAEIKIEAPEKLTGKMIYKRYKSFDQWQSQELTRKGDYLVAYIPHQPPAGKVIYKIILNDGQADYPLTQKHVIIRFKGHVPDFILWPHIFFMFASLVISFRAGLEALFKGNQTLRYSLWALISLSIGGLILGPIVQKYAFGAFWTGWPFGHDLTDNKTLANVIFWAIAVWRAKKNPIKARVWVIIAVIVTLAVYLIPHSVLGSEIDHTKAKPKTEYSPN